MKKILAMILVLSMALTLVSVAAGRRQEPRGRHDRGLHSEGVRQLFLRSC